MAKAGTLTVRILGDADGFQKGLRDATSQAEKFGKKMSSVGNKLTLGLTVPLAAAGAKAMSSASDLSESINAVNVVFGEAADKIHEFGETAATEAGLSARAFNELVTPVGAGLQNVGFSADEAAEASINLGRRAADMASVFNVDVSEALAAVQAGLRGEADPLERFGVGLSAAAVEAHALELGLADTAAELDENAKAQARVSLIMEQTDKVAGDFKNTSDEVANAQRIAAARAEDLAASFGQKLLPMKMRLLEIGTRVLDWFESLDASGQNTVLMVAGFAAALGPLAKALSGAITVARTLSTTLAFLAANPIVAVIAAVALLAAGLVIAYQRSETFRDIVDRAFEVVKLGALHLARVAVDAFQFLLDMWLAAAEGIAGSAARAFGWVPGLGDKLQSAADEVARFRDDTNAALEGVKKQIELSIDATNAHREISNLQSRLSALTSRGYNVQLTGSGGRTVGQGGVTERAHGGPLSAGQLALVGEKGPELFVPSTSGTVIPNHRLGGNGGTAVAERGGDTYNVTVNVDGTFNLDDRRGMRDLAERIEVEFVRMLRSQPALFGSKTS